MPADLVDIGLNLTHDSFAPDRADVLRRAASAGVRHMLVTGSSVSHSEAALQLAREHPDLLKATAGIHPHHATECDAHSGDRLVALLAADDVLAVGECGLDYFRDFSPRDRQAEAFRLQLDIAVQTRKPVFLHQRDAHADFTTLLSGYGGRLSGGVAHCFTAGIDEARAYLDLGLHIGITGWLCDERRGLHLRDVVRFVPGDRLLVETDAPYLLPRDLAPKPATRRNEPCYLPHIVATIARLREEPFESVAGQTTRNALALFNWPSTADSVRRST